VPSRIDQELHVPISDQERSRRRAQIEQARERVRKQGIALTKETEELSERFINGELTQEQFVEAGLKLYLPQVSPKS
jgi:Antitoxin VbhA